MSNKKAFTLVELLVSMAIIAVLIAMSVFGISIAQRVLRDNQRRAATQDLVAALNAYYSVAGAYPAASQVTVTGASEITVGTQKVTGMDGPVKPAATTTTDGTLFCYAKFTDGYFVAAVLEDGGQFADLSSTNQAATCSAAYQIK